jgi:hypothetical protein
VGVCGSQHDSNDNIDKTTYPNYWCWHVRTGSAVAAYTTNAVVNPCCGLLSTVAVSISHIVDARYTMVVDTAKRPAWKQGQPVRGHIQNPELRVCDEGCSSCIGYDETNLPALARMTIVTMAILLDGASGTLPMKCACGTPAFLQLRCLPPRLDYPSTHS